jgi:hypothetical protein
MKLRVKLLYFENKVTFANLHCICNLYHCYKLLAECISIKTKNHNKFLQIIQYGTYKSCTAIFTEHMYINKHN